MVIGGKIKQTLLVFFLLTTLFAVGCDTTSRVHLRNRDIITLEITHSTPETVFGVNEATTDNISIPREDILHIEIPGIIETYEGALLTGVGGAIAIWSVVSLAMDDDFEITAITSAALMGIGIPILVWGVTTQEDAIEKIGWEESFLPVDATPLVLHDGEKAHYGLGISGRI